MYHKTYAWVVLLLTLTMTSCAQNKQETVKLLSMEALEKIERIHPEKALQKPEEVMKLELTGGSFNDVIPKLKSFKNLQYLSLESCNLDKIPEVVFDLKQLQVLNVVGNKISVLPKQIGSLVNLQKLEVAFNPFTQLPAEIGNLEKLEHLNLSGVQLSSYPIEFTKLKNLKEVILQQSNITSLPEQYKGLASLSSIWLNQNPSLNLSETFKVLSTLPKLDEVILTDSDIKVLSTDLPALPSVKKLLLDAKNLDVKQSIPFLKKLAGLDHLYLENVSKVPENLEQLTQVKELVLRLRMTNKEDIESLFASIKAVPLLNMLQVYGIKSVPANIGELTGLTTLNLRGNFLKTLPEEIKGLGKLKLLDLQINSFPDEEKARIKKLLPNTEIKF